MSSFLDLLYAEAPREAFDAAVDDLVRAGADEADVRRQYDVALRLRDLVARQRAREAELSALYETAHDLTALRDLDAVLTAIVRRARQLLKADMTYLSLNDEEEGASYMKVTDGALTPEFERLRLPLGTGLLGLVAQTGAPYFTADYQSDARFDHRGYIDQAVDGERIRAILGVPLMLEGRVIGTLLATHRTVRPFPPEEVSLLTSFAAHASVALENARLFVDLDAAARRVSAQAEAVDRAARAHDRLTDLVLHGSSLGEVVDVLAEVLGAPVSVLDADGTHLAGPEVDAEVPAARVRPGRAIAVEGGYAAAAVAGQEHLATLRLARATELDSAERRTLERGAMVVALVLLLERSVDATEERLGGALLTDLLSGGDRDPARLRRRARRHRLRLSAGSVVAVADVDGLEPHAATRAASRLARTLGGLAGTHDGRLVLLATGEHDPLAVGADLVAAVASAGGRATVGVATGPEDALDGRLPDAHREAVQCVRALVALGRRGEVADPVGLGVARLLVAAEGTDGGEALEAFVERTLGVLVDYDAQRGTRLLETVEAWFACGGSPGAAGGLLHVHPNTVAQRLERVDRLLGADWRRPERSLDLQLALRVMALRRS